MLEAIVFALVASGALVLGSAAGALFDPPRRLVAVGLAFASGSLIAALAFELFEEADEKGGVLLAGSALIGGATVFIAIDTWLERRAPTTEATGLALLAAVTLDGVPEHLALGVSLVGGGGFVLLIAIFANFTESLGGSAAMRREHSVLYAIGLWSAAAVLLAAAVVAGQLFSGAPDSLLAVLLAFAGGAVLASLADTLMPEAYAEGGPRVAFATAVGFLVSYTLASA